jgi:hypothetical protein
MLTQCSKKTLDARRTLAYGLEFRKFKRRLNVIKYFCFFIFVMLRAKSVVITQLKVIVVTIPLVGSKISSKYYIITPRLEAAMSRS